MKKENDPACGGGGVEPGYNEKWEQSTETYCKDGFLFFLDRKYTSTDGGITWNPTNEYKEGSVNSGTPCTDSEKGYTWRIDYGQYICDGYTSYYIERYYYYYVANPNVFILAEPLQTRRSETVRLTNDPACGYVDPRKYRWNDNTGETICVGDDLYTREDYEYSDDEGVTWHKTGLTRKGTLVEAHSQTCIDATTQYKWEIDRTRWQCIGTTSYYYEKEYQSTDGDNWVATGDERLSPRTETLRLEDDPECGSGGTLYRWVEDGDNYLCEYEEGEPMEQTRWVALPKSSWVCDGWNLYAIEKEQITTDGGMNWTDTGVTRQSSTFEENANECAQKTNCVYHNGAGGLKFYCSGDITTQAMAIYLDHQRNWDDSAASYIPKVRIVTDSPQGNSWYSVVNTSHTVEGVTYLSYRVDIRSNQDEGTINCYWEVYSWQTGEVLHTTDPFKIIRTRLT